jgi:hypothetical protein
MFWLIETKEQIEHLINKQYDAAFIEIIPYHPNIHPAINGVCSVYYKPLNSAKGYMLCLHHSEALNVSKTLIDTLFKQTKWLWVRDKKNALYYFPIKSLLDINFIHLLPTPELTPTHIHLYNKYPNYKKINKIIPLVKHYQVCEDIFNKLQPHFTKELPPHFEFYNNKTTIAFFGIERNGIHINEELIQQHFNIPHEYYSIKDQYIYTHYNLFTTTSRPSNSFNAINFAALNKDNGVRQSFIPQNDKLVEIDISAYHPHLIANLIGYDFGDQDVHQVFADMYGTTYQRAKELTFKQLYGGVFKEYEHLEFFQRVKKYTDNIWEEFNNSGEVIVPISGYCFKKSELNEMNPQKLLNYILQSVETSTNVRILMEIHKLLRGKNTKIVLYTFDSFLLDYDEDENLLRDIEDIFTKIKLKIKVKDGTNYDFR